MNIYYDFCILTRKNSPSLSYRERYFDFDFTMCTNLDNRLYVQKNTGLFTNKQQSIFELSSVFEISFWKSVSLNVVWPDNSAINTLNVTADAFVPCYNLIFCTI